jgi:hypothetical protein
MDKSQAVRLEYTDTGELHMIVPDDYRRIARNRAFIEDLSWAGFLGTLLEVDEAQQDSQGTHSIHLQIADHSGEEPRDVRPSELSDRQLVALSTLLRRYNHDQPVDIYDAELHQLNDTQRIRSVR